MNRILVILIFLIFSLNAGAAKYRVTVALNLKDCINCVKAFYQLAGVSHEVDVVLIMEKEYKSDSAYIFSQYKLKELNPTVIWSDSIFREYSTYGGSMITLESEHGTERIQYGLAGIKDDLFSYIKKSGVDTDTLFKDIPDILRGVDELVFNGANLALATKYRKEINVYNLVSNKRLHTITIPEDLLRKTFVYSGLPASQYDRQQKMMIEAGVPQRYQLKDITFLEDTLLVELDTRFFNIQFPDTILGHNFSLLKYVKGKLASVGKVEMKNTVNGKVYNNLFSYLHGYKGQVYEYMADYPTTTDRYFLGKYHMVKGSYAINDVYDMRVPELYKDKIDCSFLLYYKGYFAFPLIGKLYPLDKTDSIIDLPFFQGVKDSTNWSCSYINDFLHNFVCNRNYVWLAIQRKDKGLALVKYNRATKEVVISQAGINYTRDKLIKFDPINPDYLIYKSEGGYLIRKKVFE